MASRLATASRVRQAKVGRVHDFRRERSSAGDLDGLSAMLSFVSSRRPASSSLRAGQIFGAGKFVAGVVDDVVAGQPGRDVGPQLRQLYGHNDGGEDQESFGQPAGNHAAVRKHAVGRFTGQAGLGARQGGADRRDELAPGRGPLDEQLGHVVEFDGLLELGYIGQTGWSQPPAAKFLAHPSGGGTDGYVNSIAHCRSSFHNRATGEFQHGLGLQPDWRQTPGPQLGLDVNYPVCAIEVDDVDGKPHAQSMNAMAGDDPEAVAITEVTRSNAQEPTQASPVRIRDGQSRGEMPLAGSVECLPPRGKNGHKCMRSQAARFAYPEF